jgi:hypothetical protein
MSIKAKIAAGAATLTIVGGGLGMAGTLTASAATPSCSTDCGQLFSQKYETHYVVILFQTSNSDPAEDLTFSGLGSVDSFYRSHRHLVSPQFDHAFGGEEAFEIEYAPYGLNSNFCLSTPGQTARADDNITLQSCGATAGSIFAADSEHSVRDFRSEGNEDVPLVSGATTQFSNPLVLNYPAGNPTDMPRPQLNVEPEQTYANGTVFDNQQWGVQGGPVHGLS